MAQKSSAIRLFNRNKSVRLVWQNKCWIRACILQPCVRFTAGHFNPAKTLKTLHSHIVLASRGSHTDICEVNMLKKSDSFRRILLKRLLEPSYGFLRFEDTPHSSLHHFVDENEGCGIMITNPSKSCPKPRPDRVIVVIYYFTVKRAN